MKFLELVLYGLIHLLLAESKVIPDRLPQPCSKSVPNYNECTTNFLKKTIPFLVKGVRELNFPKLNPLDVPLFRLNRTLNNLVSADTIMKNLQFSGLDQAQIEHFRFDLEKMNGELRIILPYLRVSLEFEAKGKLLDFVYDNAGHIKGNFSNLDTIFKFSLKQVDKLGVKYYSLKEMKANATIGDGFVKVISKKPEEQAAVDALVNFTNRNFQTVFNALQPIYEESLGVSYKYIVEEVLNSIPADELIPE